MSGYAEGVLVLLAINVVLAYAAFRFGIEAIRTEPVLALGITVYQAASVLLAALVAGQWWWERHAASSDGAQPVIAV